MALIDTHDVLRYGVEVSDTSVETISTLQSFLCSSYAFASSISTVLFLTLGGKHPLGSGFELLTSA